MDNLQDYIKVFDCMNAEECDVVMDWINSGKYISPFRKATTENYNDPQGDAIESQSRTNDNALIFPQTEFDEFIYQKISQSYHKWLSSIEKGMAGMWSLFYTNVVDSGYLINRYTETQFYNYHIDVLKDVTKRRILSMCLYVNDDYEGGEIEFPYFCHKPKRGEIIVFPSIWLYPHRSRPVITGTKYSIVTWFMEVGVTERH